MQWMHDMPCYQCCACFYHLVNTYTGTNVCILLFCSLPALYTVHQYGSIAGVHPSLQLCEFYPRHVLCAFGT